MANYTILLIDYEPRSIERFRQPLTEAGYTVEVATDGLSGIESFHRLNPDMVLVEAMIPKKHGFEVCQELKRTPHGRRTPVLITTGVYKGRKYRTQALHIYGCDEYIEKPIAPEQLLAVVGKFFGATAAAPAQVSESRGASPVGGVAIAPGDGEARTPAPSRTSGEPSTPRPQPPKSSSTPTAVVKDLTEEEIMARLDAILPGGEGGPTANVDLAAAESTVLSAADPVAAATEEPPSDTEHNPFLQMQAEISAELGSLSAALALEPAPVFDPLPQTIPSDQAMAPSLLEALPVPELEQIPELPELPPTAEVPVAPAAPAPAPAEEQPGQVVNFDVKRSRKNKKGAKRTQDRAASPYQSAPSRTETPKAEAPATQAPPQQLPTIRTVEAVSERRDALAVPRGTLVESEIEGGTGKQGVPLWVWAAVVVVGLVAVYFTMLRGGANRSDAQPVPSAAIKTTENAATDNAAGPTPSGAAENDNAGLVLNSISAPPPRAQASIEPPVTAEPSTPPPANALALTDAREPKPSTRTETTDTLAAAPKRAATTHTGSAAGTNPAAESAPKVAVPIAAPAGLDESVAGVETLSEPTARPSVPTLAPGTLVEAEDLDTAPVSLSRKLPVYSMQARQMRLQGTVVMKVLVNERGTVDDVVLVSGVPGADLNASAVRAAKAWTYRPATKSGVPVKVWKVEQVAFKM